MSKIKKIPWKALLILAIGLIVGVGLGANFGHKISWLSFEKTLNSTTISEAVNKPTTAVTTNNKVELKKNKGSLIFSPTTEQSYCDSLIQVFIDTTSVREFRKQKRKIN